MRHCIVKIHGCQPPHYERMTLFGETVTSASIDWHGRHGNQSKATISRIFFLLAFSYDVWSTFQKTAILGIFPIIQFSRKQLCWWSCGWLLIGRWLGQDWAFLVFLIAYLLIFLCVISVCPGRIFRICKNINLPSFLEAKIQEQV